MPLFLAANSTSEALQTRDVDLSAAAQNVASLKERIVTLDDEFDLFFERNLIRYGVLDISVTERSTKRNRKVPASLQNCLMDRYLTDSSSAVANIRHASRGSSEDEVAGRLLSSCNGCYEGCD